MYAPRRAPSMLDDIASDFLARHGIMIDAEPPSQTFRWARYSEAPPRRGTAKIHVPVSAFLDLPLVARHTPQQIKWLRDCACGTKCMGQRCDRCYRRDTRATFVIKWNKRYTNAGSIMQAVISEGAWEGSKEDGTLQRVAISPVATEEEEESALKLAFAAAIDANSEPEVFRQILKDFGFGEVIEARDARRERGLANRTAAYRARKRAPKVDVVPLVMTLAQAQAAAEELILRPQFGGWRVNTRSQWTEKEQVALQVLCAAETPIETAADTLGRSPSSMAWRADDQGLCIPQDWRRYLRPPGERLRPVKTREDRPEERVLARLAVAYNRLAARLEREERIRCEREEFRVRWEAQRASKRGAAQRAKAEERARRKAEAQRPALAYPYVGVGTRPHELLALVNQAVPRYLEPDLRADICQELALGLLGGEFSRDDLAPAVREATKRVRKLHPGKFGPISIDAPIPGTDGLRLIDTLAAPAEYYEEADA